MAAQRHAEVDFEFDYRLKYSLSVSVLSRKTGTMKAWDAILDTGASSLIVPDTVFLALGYPPPTNWSASVHGFGGAVAGAPQHLDAFAIGDMNLGRTRVTVLRTDAPSAQSLRNVIIIGASVLGWFNMAIDSDNSRIILDERILPVVNGANLLKKFEMPLYEATKLLIDLQT